MTNETDSFVQEVDESLRQDRMLTLVKRYGPMLLVAFVVMLAAMAGWQYWRANEARAAAAQGQTYAAAQQLAGAGNLEAAKSEFARLSQTGPAVYRTMAKLEHAAILELDGDLEGAIREFDEAAAAARDPILRETAQLRAAYIVADTQDFAALQARLLSLTQSGSRLSFLARELLGVEAWEAGELGIARRELQGLTLALDAPETVRQRAQLALAVIGPAQETPAEGASPAPAPSEGESK